MKKGIIAFSLAALLLLSGCSEIKADNPKDGNYATQNQNSALEYGIYMNKQIQVFINQISSRQAIARNINSGFNADNEVALTEESIKTMQETYDEVITVNPSNGADDNRESTLTAMQTAIDHMEGYRDAVKNGDSVDGYVKDFQNDFDQLTGLANLYNE